MIRSLMAGTALLALLTTGTLAQDQTAPAQTAAGEAVQTQQQNQALANNLLGQPVFSAARDAERIGQIDDLIVDQNGRVTAAVIGVGGFLGVGEKNIAVPIDQFQVVQDQGGETRLVLNTTREQLTATEDFRPQENQRTASGMTPDEQRDLTLGLPLGFGTPATPVGQDTVEQLAQGEVQPSAENVQQPTADDQQAGQQQTDQQNVTATQPEGAQQAEPQVVTVTQPEDGQPAQADAGAAQPSGQQVGFLSPEDQDQMRASAYVGREVYSGDESIGEISDIVLSPEGRAESAIVDVGGFLGAGERQVAIPFADIQPQAVQGEQEPRLTVALDRSRIEALPAHEATQQVAAPQGEPPRQGEQTGGQQVAGQEGDVVVVYRGNQKIEGGEAALQQTSEAAQPGDPQQAADGGQPQVVATQDGAAQPQSGQAPQAVSGLSAERLMGSQVFDVNNESIGEVDDVILARGGDVRAVVVDVGGFLGVGEKPVAIQFDALNVQQDKGGEVRLMVNATEDQLQNAPEYRQAE